MYITIGGKRVHLSRYEVRLIKKAAIAVLVILITFGIIRGICDNVSQHTAMKDTGCQYKVVMITADKPTLWDLAPDGIDKRNWISEVRRINNVNPGQLQIGQGLYAPIEN